MKANLKSVTIIFVVALLGTCLVLVSSHSEAEAEDAPAGFEVRIDDGGMVVPFSDRDCDEEAGEDEEEAEGEEEEEVVDVPLSKVPREVLSVVRHAVKGIQLKEAERRYEDGLVVYELDGEAWGRKLEIEVAMRMMVVEVESDDQEDDATENGGKEGGEDKDKGEDQEEEDGVVEIALSKVPEEVKMLVRHTVEGIELTGAEREVEDGVVLYGVRGLAWGHTFEVEVALRVSVTEIESGDGEDEEDGNENEEDDDEEGEHEGQHGHQD